MSAPLSPPARRLLWQLAATSGPLPPALLEVLLTHAAREDRASANAGSLLYRVVARPEMDHDRAWALASRAAIPVVVSYLRRAGLSAQRVQQVLGSDRRVTLRREAAAATGAGPALYEALSAGDDLATARALLANYDTPPVAAVAALATVEAQVHVGTRMAEETGRHLTRLSEEALNAVATACTTAWVAMAVADRWYRLTPTSRRAVLDVVAASPLRTADDSHLRDLVRLLARDDADEPLRRHLAATLAGRPFTVGGKPLAAALGLAPEHDPLSVPWAQAALRSTQAGYPPAVARALLRAAGDEPSRWAAVLALAGTFRGTVAELVTVVEAMGG